MSVRGRQHEYSWREVQRVRVVRVEALRQDFVKLQVFLPDEELALQYVSHQGGRSQTWRGEQAEVIAEFLQQRVSPDRFDVDIVGECPHRREDAESMLVEASERLRSIHWCLACFAPLTVAAFAWTALDGSIWKALILYGGMCLIFVPLFAFVLRRLHKDVEQCRQWLTKLEEQRSI